MYLAQQTNTQRHSHTHTHTIQIHRKTTHTHREKDITNKYDESKRNMFPAMTKTKLIAYCLMADLYEKRLNETFLCKIVKA